MYVFVPDDLPEEEDLISKSVTALSDINVNNVRSGKSELAKAASQGDIALMKKILSRVEGCSKEPPSKGDIYTNRKREKPTNQGYFVVVHDDETEEENQASNETTPEGMDNLEWDPDIELSDIFQDQDDMWSSQYKWYARILARTSMVIDPVKASNPDDVNYQDQMGRCAIHYAADAGHVDAVNLLLNSGSRIDISDVDSLTALHLAANRGEYQVVEALLKKGAFVNKRSTDKLTPLHYACSRGYLDIVAALIQYQANLNALDNGERSPLYLAACRDLYDVVKILLEAGAKVNIEDVKGYTALCEAVWHKNIPMSKLLLEHGAKLTPTAYLLHYAILHRHEEMVKLLIENGAIVNIRDERGSTPLIFAVKTKQPKIIALLLQNGAHVDFCGGLSWKTPLITAIESKKGEGDLEVILKLIEGGANINKCSWSVSPLSASILWERLDVAVMLLAYGAALEIHEDGNLDAITLARASSHGEYIRAMAYVGCNIYRGTQGRFIHTAQGPNRVVTKSTEIVHYWVNHFKSQPLKLTEIARIKIRKMKPDWISMPKYVTSLELPPSLVSYLMLSDILPVPGINYGPMRLI